MNLPTVNRSRRRDDGMETPTNYILLFMQGKRFRIDPLTKDEVNMTA